MKELSFKARSWRLPSLGTIGGIPNYRMAKEGQMDANLMGTSGEWP